MLIRIGVESGFEGHSIAWALDFPGCYANGQDDSEAIMRLPRALINYSARIEQRAAQPWVTLGDFDLRVVETFNVYIVNEEYELVDDGYEVNAWFKHDWKPLKEEEVQHGLLMAAWNRQDLLEIVRDLSDEQLDRTYPGERWPIRGILKHVANAEWWYLDRLGLAGLERQQMSEDTFERLDRVRARFNEVLPTLACRDDLVRGKEAEFWSPRKVLRRALWHEQDHIEHILKLLLQ